MTALQRIIKYCAVALAVFLIVAIISGICGAISMVSFFFDGDAAGEMQTYTVSSDVESLDLEVSAAALEIVTGDSFSVESNHKYLLLKEDNGALRISEEKILFGVSSDGVTVILTVPEGFVFEDAAISAGAGKVSVDTFSANVLSLDLGDAELTLLGKKDDYRIEVDKGVGGATLDGKVLSDDSIWGGGANRIDVDGGVGSIHIRFENDTP